MRTYKEEITLAMTKIGEMDKTIFIGQQILFPGNPMSATLENVPKHKMIEVPVMEDTQMGMSLGMAMNGYQVVTFYPRWDFLICATNQLVNHVDKIKLMSNGEWKPNIIIRVGKGSDVPLDPGHQHKGNYFNQFKTLCPNITLHELLKPDDVQIAYNQALSEGGVQLIAEYPQYYGNK